MDCRLACVLFFCSATAQRFFVLLVVAAVVYLCRAEVQRASLAASEIIYAQFMRDENVWGALHHG